MEQHHATEQNLKLLAMPAPVIFERITKSNKSSLESAPHTAQSYCGVSKGVTKDKLCILAAAALNKNKTEPNQWDVWVVNHLNIIKQVASPGD